MPTLRNKKQEKVPKYKVLTYEEKLNAIKLVENGVSIMVVARQFKVSRHTIWRAIKQKDEVEQELQERKIKPTIKRRKSCHFPEIEEKLINFICALRAIKFPVTKQVIVQEAKRIANKMGGNPSDKGDLETKSHEENKNSIKKVEFTGSDGWFNNFKRRYELNSKKLSGEAESSKFNQYKEELNKIGLSIMDFSVHNVYNMDEAGLFYKMLPSVSYCLPSEGQVHGTKQNKERLTFVLCCNMSGTQKLPIAIIGKSQLPTCFRKRGVPSTPYFFNDSAWMKSDIFKKWFEEIFVLHVRSRTSDPVLLILDGCSAHCKVEYDGITIVKLPPNVTSTSQPMDQGIISAVKRNYRSKLLVKMTENIANFVTTLNRARRKSGLGNGGLPDILDAIELLNESWKNISSETIVKCWIRSNIILPDTINLLTQINQINVQEESNDKTSIEKVCENIANAKFPFSNSQNNPQYTDLQDKNAWISKIENWFEIEKDPLVTIEIIRQELDKLDLKHPEDSDEDEDEKEEQTVGEIPLIENECDVSSETLLELQIMANKMNCILSNRSVKEKLFKRITKFECPFQFLMELQIACQEELKNPDINETEI